AYDSGDPTSRSTGLYNQTFIDRFIKTLSNGGRIIAGEFDDPYQLDEKGIFDLVNLGRSDLGGIQGARNTPIEDVFSGFNVFSIALEIPTAEVFPNGIPHNGQLQATSTDSLLRIWASITCPATQTVDATNLGRPIPVADGSTGDVITLDAAINSQFPNGRRLGGGTAPNKHQVNVNSVLISLIAAGDPGFGLAKGVEVNDKDFLPRFPFLAPPHQGLLQR